MRDIRAIVGMVLLAACGGETAPPPPISVTFDNDLRLPITITADGISPTIVKSTSTIVLPGGTTQVTWTEEKETYSDGTPIPDDLGPVTLLVADKATLTIDNVVGTTTYFEPYLYNKTGVTVGVAIVNGNVARCLGSQDAGEGGSRWGYYALGPDTEWRIYKAGTKCTGTFRRWSTSTITDAMFGNGTVLLESSTPP